VSAGPAIKRSPNKDAPSIKRTPSLACGKIPSQILFALVRSIVKTEPNAVLHRGARYGAKPIAFEFDLGVGENRDSFTVKLARMCEKLIDRNRLTYVARTDTCPGSEQDNGGHNPSNVSHAV